MPSAPAARRQRAPQDPPSRRACPPRQPAQKELSLETRATLQNDDTRERAKSVRRDQTIKSRKTSTSQARARRNKVLTLTKSAPSQTARASSSVDRATQTEPSTGIQTLPQPKASPKSRPHPINQRPPRPARQSTQSQSAKQKRGRFFHALRAQVHEPALSKTTMFTALTFQDFAKSRTTLHSKINLKRRCLELTCPRSNGPSRYGRAPQQPRRSRRSPQTCHRCNILISKTVETTRARAVSNHDDTSTHKELARGRGRQLRDFEKHANSKFAPSKRAGVSRKKSRLRRPTHVNFSGRDRRQMKNLDEAGGLGSTHFNEQSQAGSSRTHRARKLCLENITNRQHLARAGRLPKQPIPTTFLEKTPQGKRESPA